MEIELKVSPSLPIWVITLDRQNCHKVFRHNGNGHADSYRMSASFMRMHWNEGRNLQDIGRACQLDLNKNTSKFYPLFYSGMYFTHIYSSRHAILQLLCQLA